MTLHDKFGRQITDLRISVTDRCNFRCVYCRSANPENYRDHDEILSWPDTPTRWKVSEVSAHPPPVLATQMRLGDLQLNMFTMLSTFGTPQDLTTDSLRVEHLFPADAQSEALLKRLAGL